MKTTTKLLQLTVLLFILTTCSFAQNTYAPSCYSNADGWTVSRIERYTNRTLVYMSLYSSREERFFFHPSMYIENYSNPYEQKLYVRSAMYNQLDTWYTTNAKTQYDFILEFPPIPTAWTDVNIKEPASQGNTAWYWNYISLNQSQNNRLKIDNFFLNSGIGFLAGAAHPFDVLKKYVYNVDYKQITLSLYYNDGYHTMIKIRKDGEFLSFNQNTVADYNCTFCSAFLSMDILKQTIQNESNYQTNKTDLERYFGRVLNQMNGYDVASVILTLMWWGYS